MGEIPVVTEHFLDHIGDRPGDPKRHQDSSI